MMLLIFSSTISFSLMIFYIIFGIYPQVKSFKLKKQLYQELNDYFNSSEFLMEVLLDNRCINFDFNLFNKIPRFLRKKVFLNLLRTEFLSVCSIRDFLYPYEKKFNVDINFRVKIK